MGRSAGGLCSRKYSRTLAACARAARQSAHPEDRHLAKGRADRCHFVSLATGKRRFPKSRSEIRTDEPADVYRRMCERDFLAPEKRIRHAPKSSALRHGAIEGDAADAEARPDQFAE